MYGRKMVIQKGSMDSAYSFPILDDINDKIPYTYVCLNWSDIQDIKLLFVKSIVSEKHMIKSLYNYVEYKS